MAIRSACGQHTRQFVEQPLQTKQASTRLACSASRGSEPSGNIFRDYAALEAQQGSTSTSELLVRPICFDSSVAVS